LAQVGLELNLDKTRIAYCKDANRKGSHEHERFTFLGYTFGPRRAQNRRGVVYANFLPAVSDDAANEIRHTIKRWRLHLQSEKSLDELAQGINPTARAWVNYYGRFYRSELIQTLEHINTYLMRWAMRKFKRLRGRPARAWRFLQGIAAREPTLFAHWAAGAKP
jgi:RNA-directed DNA polymerase